MALAKRNSPNGNDTRLPHARASRNLSSASVNVTTTSKRGTHQAGNAIRASRFAFFPGLRLPQQPAQHSRRGCLRRLCGAICMRLIRNIDGKDSQPRRRPSTLVLCFQRTVADGWEELDCVEDWAFWLVTAPPNFQAGHCGES